MKMGLDVGYSGVKLCYGTGPAPAVQQLPVGAGPAHTCVVDLTGENWPGTGQSVLVNGQPWVAGVDPVHLSDFERRMDESYPASDEYLALYYAALASVPSTKISTLVTGLPVRQFQDEAQRNALRDRLMGRHQVRADLVVDVAHVVVVPQPAGAFRAHARQSLSLSADKRLRADETCLIVDPGHYSLDWVVFAGGFHPASSGSTSSAGQVIVSRTAAKLSQQLKVRIPEARLERAIMRGQKKLLVGEREVEFWSTVEDVAQDIVDTNLKALRGSIRSINDRFGVDVVLLAGGGAALFEKALRKVFDASRVIVAAEPVMANARGFYDYALSTPAPASAQAAVA